MNCSSNTRYSDSVYGVSDGSGAHAYKDKLDYMITWHTILDLKD